MKNWRKKELFKQFAIKIAKNVFVEPKENVWPIIKWPYRIASYSIIGQGKEKNNKEKMGGKKKERSCAECAIYRWNPYHLGVNLSPLASNFELKQCPEVVDKLQ